MSAQDALLLITAIIAACRVLAADPDFAVPEVKRLGQRIELRAPLWNRALERCAEDPKQLKSQAELIKSQSQIIVNALCELKKECDESGGLAKALKKKVFHDKIVGKISRIDVMINNLDLDMGHVEKSIEFLTTALKTPNLFEKLLQIMLFLEAGMVIMRKRFQARPTWTLLSATFSGLTGVGFGLLFAPETGGLSLAGSLGAGALAHALRMDEEDTRKNLFGDLQKSMLNVEKLRLKSLKLQEKHSKQVMISTTERLTALEDELLSMMDTMDNYQANQARKKIGCVTDEEVRELWAEFDSPKSANEPSSALSTRPITVHALQFLKLYLLRDRRQTSCSHRTPRSEHHERALRGERAPGNERRQACHAAPQAGTPRVPSCSIWSGNVLHPRRATSTSSPTPCRQTGSRARCCGTRRAPEKKKRLARKRELLALPKDLKRVRPEPSAKRAELYVAPTGSSKRVVGVDPGKSDLISSGTGPVLGWGDWGRGSQMKFLEPTKGVGMRKLFSRAGYEVVLVDEFRTSCTCFGCEGGACEKFRVVENPRPWMREKRPMVLRHGLLSCQNCKRLWNRDRNGSLNIMRCAQAARLGGQRPSYMTRNFSEARSAVTTQGAGLPTMAVTRDPKCL
ncbi:hypothetical protein BASA81_000570 [Batrachochytrium salamandrivorans]|nr:hypothetical protein BASA81_000570 [Batrachochytrium salamandrivorans]